MNTYWISLPCDLLSSLASFQCSLLHHLHLSSDLGLSKYVNQHSHLNLSRNVRLSVLYDLDFNRFDSNRLMRRQTAHTFQVRTLECITRQLRRDITEAETTIGIAARRQQGKTKKVPDPHHPRIDINHEQVQ